MIDGIDEYDGRDQWMSELVAVINARSRSPQSFQMKMLLTSRPEYDLCRISECFSTIELTSQKTREDIRQMVYATVEEGLKDGSIVIAKESLKHEIIIALV
jgi:hypothetical protein